MHALRLDFEVIRNIDQPGCAALPLKSEVNGENHGEWQHSLKYRSNAGDMIQH